MASTSSKEELGQIAAAKCVKLNSVNAFRNKSICFCPCSNNNSKWRKLKGIVLSGHDKECKGKQFKYSYNVTTGSANDYDYY